MAGNQKFDWNIKFEIGAKAAFVIGAMAVGFAAVLVKEPGLAFWALVIAAVVAV